MRPGNAVEVLIDGAEALPAIAAELDEARSHVHLTGWHFSPDFALDREGDPVVLRNLLAELAERLDVRVLAWAGAPLPLFRPSRADVRKMRDQLIAHTKIECALDAKERPMHCHHEKTIVIDDRVAFVGGIDLTSESGDRYDTNDHPARAERRLARRLRAHRRPRRRRRRRALPHALARGDGRDARRGRPVAGRPARSSCRSCAPCRRSVYTAKPKGEFSILESYIRALKARRAVHLHREPVPLVARDRGRAPREDRRPSASRLPAPAAAPGEAEQRRRRHARRARRADRSRRRRRPRSRLHALRARGNLADPIYVHAKIAIIDDKWLTLGSANLNEHSLFNDTEMNVVSHDPEVARQTRLRLWSEHLELPDRRDPRPTRSRRSTSSGSRSARNSSSGATPGLPLTHRLVRLPRRVAPLRPRARPAQGLLVDG